MNSLFKKNLLIFLLSFSLMVFTIHNVTAEKKETRKNNIDNNSSSKQLISPGIDKFDCDIDVLKNADVLITEKITYNFVNQKRHGIFRFIPVKYTTEKGVHRSIKVKDIKVLMDGKSVHFTTNKSGKNIKIKIGEANKLISGQHLYQISYIVQRAINYFDDHSEFYWNVTGSEWTNGNMKKVLVNIKAPQIAKATSFKGVKGSQTNCKKLKQDDDKVSFDCQQIKDGEEVTIVVGMAKDVLKKPSFLEKFFYFLKDNLILGLPILVFVFMFKKWKKEGKDPKGRGTIIPFYDTPENLSVGEVAFIMHGKLPNNALSAMLIQLAVKGYIKIKQIGKDRIFKGPKYVFIKTIKNNTEKLTESEKTLFDKLFSLGSDGKVKSENLAYNFYRYLPQIKKQIGKSVLQKGYFKQLPGKVFAKWLSISIFFLFVGFFFSSFFGALGFISFLLSGLIIMGFSFIMPKLTKKGVEVREKLEGFKLYLKTAEKDRIKFHNAPEKKPEIFEKFLPYAMVFGVEKEWAKQFQDIYKNNPDWYEGAGNNLNAIALVDSLDSFNSMVGSSITTSSSSASSGGSGFSGGGSGGGFGGGGGGDW